MRRVIKEANNAVGYGAAEGPPAPDDDDDDDDDVCWTEACDEAFALAPIVRVPRVIGVVGPLLSPPPSVLLALPLPLPTRRCVGCSGGVLAPISGIPAPLPLAEVGVSAGES